MWSNLYAETGKFHLISYLGWHGEKEDPEQYRLSPKKAKTTIKAGYHSLLLNLNSD